MPATAIVILNWNGRKYLEQFLPSVIACTYPKSEIIVADNASTDDSISFLLQNYPTVRIIELKENLGFAKGYNTALQEITADYYVLLNSDVEVGKNWIAPIISLMEKDSSIAACQPKILMERDRSKFEYSGASGGWLDFLGYPFARGRIFDVCEEDNGQYNDSAQIFWASGAALFVRAVLFHSIGRLDEYFFAHQEEIDLCWRLQLAGYKIMVCPESVVYHVGGGTLPKGNKLKVYLNFRNNLIMMAKNLPLGQSLWKLPARFVLDSISAWKSLFSGQGIYFIAVFKAHLGFIRWLLVERGKSVFPGSKKGDLMGWFKSSVVWQYFIKGRTKFSEIVENKNG